MSSHEKHFNEELKLVIDISNSIKDLEEENIRRKRVMSELVITVDILNSLKELDCEPVKKTYSRSLVRKRETRFNSNEYVSESIDSIFTNFENLSL